jgi:hypothetical protein
LIYAKIIAIQYTKDHGSSKALGARQGSLSFLSISCFPCLFAGYPMAVEEKAVINMVESSYGKEVARYVLL